MKYRWLLRVPRFIRVNVIVVLAQAERFGRFGANPGTPLAGLTWPVFNGAQSADTVAVDSYAPLESV